MTDHELIKQYRLDGNEEAFTQLVNRHVDWVFSMAFRRTNHVENAKEITQSAFTLLARNASKFNGKQHVGL